MPTKDEMIRAHDMLVSILNREPGAHDTLASIHREPPIEFAGDEKLVLMAGLDALCWVLGHEHNPQFETNLDLIRGKLKEAGYVAASMISGTGSGKQSEVLEDNF